MLWQSQQEANIIAFLEDEEYGSRKKFLFEMIKKFQKEKVEWSLFCSSSLFFLGIVDDFNDFDLLISESSMEKAKSLLTGMKMKLVREEMFGINIREGEFTAEEMKVLAKVMAKAVKGTFSSNQYANFSSRDGVKVDASSGFRVVAMDTQYLYEYSPHRISFVEIEGIKIPVVCAEAQFVQYCMMECWQPQRKFKRRMIANYLKENGISFPDVFEEALKERIPSWIRQKVRETYSEAKRQG